MTRRAASTHFDGKAARAVVFRVSGRPTLTSSSGDWHPIHVHADGHRSRNRPTRGAFGGVIGFDGPARIDRFSVIMSNWNGWDPSGKTGGSATAGYQTDLTLELYDVDRGGLNPGPGDLIVEDTETHDIAGREIPTATNASYAGAGTDFVVDWDLGGLTVGDETLFTVRMDELVGKGFGNPPANSALQSLNIAALANGTPPDVTAGVDTDNGVYWRSDASTGGTISRFEAGQVMARVEGMAPVPLPPALSLLAAGIGGLVLIGRRRKT